MITFRCPNGHSLSCPTDRAGRKARCPRCQVEVSVPQPTDRVEKTGSSLSGLDFNDVIVFLCPNGHRLNGPTAMQGKPGQCPHCHEKFIVPSYDNVDPIDDFADSQIGHSHLSSLSGSLSGASGLYSGPFEAGFTMRELFHWLWKQREVGVREVEVHLNDGNSIVPDYYFESSSSEQCGVFATEEHMDAYELHVVRWDAISRLLVSNLTELPGELG